MKLKTQNGGYITGTLETIPGEALAAHFFENGSPIYDGETKVFWDRQETVCRNGSVVYLDEDGDEWTFDQLELVPDDHTDEDDE